MDGSIADSGCWFKQGDADRKVSDWYLGKTATGLIMESHRLLVRHELKSAKARLPDLEKVAAF